MNYYRIALAAVALAGLTPSVGWGAEAFTVGKKFRDCNDCPMMVTIPKGSFMMGADKGATKWESSAETPSHKVTIKYQFAIGVYEVTQAEYLAIMGSNPSYYQGNLKAPVEWVSELDGEAFAAKLSQKTGKHYRLPSEAEWEYVARAGKQTPWFFSTKTKDPGGSCPSYISSQLDQYVWNECNSAPPSPSDPWAPHTVGTRKANPFGVFDIYGNVNEWVRDCWHPNYKDYPNDKMPTDGSAWMTGNACNVAVRKGGAYRSYPNDDVRSSSRSYWYRDNHDSERTGFRVVRELTP